jgi:serine/threonine protein kinase
MPVLFVPLFLLALQSTPRLLTNRAPFWAISCHRNDCAGKKTPLAVKMMIASNASVQDGEDFLLETETMAKMGAHPNITSLIGVSFQEQPWLVAIEFMKYGDLLQVVQTCREKKMLLRPVEMLYLFTQIAAGMRYIAALRLVHMAR